MAGRIPSSFIDDLIARSDIVDIVDSRVKLKKAGRNYQACCPFHNEKTPSFSVSQEKQFYYGI
jgi:DNA primase